MQIEYIRPSELKTYLNNAKIHTAEQIEQIKKSIVQFGFVDPVGIWKDNTIVEGNGRVIAAIELGLGLIPVVRLGELTKEQFQAYVLVHNQLALNTGFDSDVLHIELDNIHDVEMSDFGFSDVDTTEYFDDEYVYDKPKRFLVVLEKGTREEELRNLLNENNYKYRIR